MIGLAACADPGQDAQAEREWDHQKCRHRGENRAVEERVLDESQNRCAGRLSLCDRCRRIAEVSGDCIAEPVEVSNDEGMIESELRVELADLLRACALA